MTGSQSQGLLEEISRVALSPATTGERAQLIVRAIAAQPGLCDWVGIFETGGPILSLSLIAWAGSDAAPSPASAPGVSALASAALAARGTVVCPDVDPATPYVPEVPGTRSEIAVPVFNRADGSVPGLINAKSRTTGAFGESQRELFESCASVVSLIWLAQTVLWSRPSSETRGSSA